MFRKLMIIILFLILNFRSAFANIAYEKISGKDSRGNFDLELIQVKQGYLKDKLRNKLNKKLRNILIENMYCEPLEQEKDRMHSKTNIDVTLLNKSYLSFRLNYDIYCAGPYPDSGAQYYIFDLKTANKVDFESTLKNKRAFKSNLYNKFKINAPSKVSVDCAKVYKELGKGEYSFKYLFSKKGLVGSYDFPHVIRACEFDMELGR